MTFIAGPYTATYQPALGGSTGLTLGITEDGFEIETVPYADLIRGDNLGESIQDGVYRGKDVYISMVLEEWDLDGVQRLMQPYTDRDSITDVGEITQVGRLLTAMAGILILTPVAGTGAATSAGILTASKAIIAPGFPLRQLLATRHRKIPIRMLLLPYVEGSDTVHYRWAAPV
jgi:hypothetical protein